MTHLRGDVACCAEADGERRGDGTGAEAALLATAAHLGLEANARPAAHVERADALGAVQFVA